MCPKSPEDVEISLDLKSEPVVMGNSSLPDVSGIIHFFDIQRGMAAIGKQKVELLVNSLLDSLRKPTIILNKALGESNFHIFARFRALTASLALSKEPITLPSSISLSASASLSCHSFV